MSRAPAFFKLDALDAQLVIDALEAQTSKLKLGAGRIPADLQADYAAMLLRQDVLKVRLTDWYDAEFERIRIAACLPEERADAR